jgi:hypothetical protein
VTGLTDVDIDCVEDGFRFQQLIPDLEKLGYEVDEAYFGFKIYLIENKEDRLHNVCCDVFMMAKDGDKFHYYSPETYKRWPAYVFEKDLFPLKANINLVILRVGPKTRSLI